MKSLYKPILCLISVSLFLLFAMASFGPDESSNTTIAISNCKEQPGVTGELHVNVYLHFKQGAPIQVPGLMFIEHQKVRPDTTCKFDVLYSETVEFETDVTGHYSYIGPHWFHDNSEDLFRVEVKLKRNDAKQYYQEVKVLKYANSDFNFNGVIQTPLD